jgi:hypothetical protein
MRLPRRVFAICLGMSAILGLGALSISAQDPAKKDESAKGAHRLPAGYGQISISDAQKEKIYGIQDKFAEKIAPLQKQLAALRADEAAECEAVLTDAQKKLLVEKRAEAKKKRGGAGKGEAPKKDGPNS